MLKVYWNEKHYCAKYMIWILNGELNDRKQKADVNKHLIESYGNTIIKRNTSPRLGK